MTGEIRRLATAGAGARVTKKQLAAHLQRSVRWIELRVAEGMPQGPLNAAGRRLFDPEACEAWLRARYASAERAPSLAERVERLERELAELRAAQQTQDRRPH